MTQHQQADAHGLRALPGDVLLLLDGTDLEAKVGQTLLIAVASQPWPRVAALAVGEVHAPSAGQVNMALYADSRTARALTEGGGCVLLVVVNRRIVKIYLTMGLVQGEGDGTNAYFSGTVNDVEVDAVEYAEVTAGISYELHDEAAALRRWKSTVRRMAALPALGS